MPLVMYSETEMPKEKALGPVDTGLPSLPRGSEASPQQVEAASRELKSILAQVGRIKRAIMQCKKKRGGGGLKAQVDNAYAWGCGGSTISEQWITKHISPKVVYGRRSKVRGHIWALHMLGRRFRRICDEFPKATF